MIGVNMPPGGPRTPQVNPSCPKCQTKMGLKTIIPVMAAPDTDDVTYVCPNCETQITHRQKRPV